jgi:hypothetical protein
VTFETSALEPNVTRRPRLTAQENCHRPPTADTTPRFGLRWIPVSTSSSSLFLSSLRHVVSEPELHFRSFGHHEDGRKNSITVISHMDARVHMA